MATAADGNPSDEAYAHAPSTSAAPPPLLSADVLDKSCDPQAPSRELRLDGSHLPSSGGLLTCALVSFGLCSRPHAAHMFALSSFLPGVKGAGLPTQG